MMQFVYLVVRLSLLFTTDPKICSFI